MSVKCFVLGREYSKMVQTLDVPKYKAKTLLFMYVICMLFYAIGGGLVDLIFFNRSYMADTLLRV